MNWRDRLALWCLRRLVPNGIGSQGGVSALVYDSGLSSPDDPKLVMRIAVPDANNQTIVSVVLNLDTAVGRVQEAVDGIRAWAARAR